MSDELELLRERVENDGAGHYFARKLREADQKEVYSDQHD